MSPGSASSETESKHMQACTSHTIHMWVHIHTRLGTQITQAENITLPEPTEKKNVVLPQMLTAEMGQSCSSSPSVQY